jgi:hypothetical protein
MNLYDINSIMVMIMNDGLRLLYYYYYIIIIITIIIIIIIVSIIIIHIFTILINNRQMIFSLFRIVKNTTLPNLFLNLPNEPLHYNDCVLESLSHEYCWKINTNILK